MCKCNFRCFQIGALGSIFWSNSFCSERVVGSRKKSDPWQCALWFDHNRWWTRKPDFVTVGAFMGNFLSLFGITTRPPKQANSYFDVCLVLELLLIRLCRHWRVHVHPVLAQCIVWSLPPGRIKSTEIYSYNCFRDTLVQTVNVGNFYSHFDIMERWVDIARCWKHSCADLHNLIFNANWSNQPIYCG
jgi:hypothetical protein